VKHYQIKKETAVATFIRHPKDFWTGIIFLLIGVSTVIIGQDYSMGSAASMGPAYFPVMLGGLLSIIGIIAVVRSAIRYSDVAISRFYIRELVLVLVAVLLFGFLIRGAGLVLAAIVLVVLSAYAGPKFHLGKTLALACGLAVFAVLLFVKLLGLPMPIFGPLFGGA
jgi:hypothetical protein